MAEKWSNIIQSYGYQQLSDPDKKKVKEEYWDKITSPELKKQKRSSKNIEVEKNTFFTQSSVLVPETEVQPLSMQTTGTMQRFERQVVPQQLPVERPPVVKERIPITTEISRVTKGPMQKIERQIFPVKKTQEEKFIEALKKAKKEKVLTQALRLPFKEYRKRVKKLSKRYSPFLITEMIKRDIPLTEKNAFKSAQDRQIRESEFSRMLHTGLRKGLTTFPSVYEKMRERYPEIKLGEPRTKKGKTWSEWMSFATVILNPLSPYRYLPGGQLIKGVKKLKALKATGVVLKKYISPKILPHAYRIMENSIKGGINIPLITLADRTIKTVNDPDYQFKEGLIETRKAILPGMVIGAVIPEAVRGLRKFGRGIGKKLFTGIRKKFYYKRLGIIEKDIEPIRWSQKILKTKDIRVAQRNFQKKIDEFNAIRPEEKVKGWEERIDDLREQHEAFSILNKTRITPAGKLITKEIQVKGFRKFKVVFPKMPKLPVTESYVKENYKKLRSTYIGSKDVTVLDSKVEAVNLQKVLKNTMKQKKYNTKVKIYDAAMKLYSDLKGAPGDIRKYWPKLNEPQRKLVILSQKLPKEIKKIALYLERSGKITGEIAKDAELIKNVNDNWVNRVWDPKSFGKEKIRFRIGRKFGIKTRHALPRRLSSILEGWAKGGKLNVNSAISSLQIYKEEIARTIADKRFLKILQKLKTPDGRPFLSRVKYDDYGEIKHPNFKPYRQQRWTAEIRQQLKYGKEFGKGNAFIRKGKLFMPVNLYAPKYASKDLNNMLMPSALMKIPGIPTLTKYNAILKAWTLQGTLFHPVAFIRSALLGGNITKFKDITIRRSAKEGRAFVESSEPLIRLGVKQGLTLGIIQDWQEELVREKTGIGRLLDKWRVSRVVKDKLMDLRSKHVNWMFGKFGMGLKAKAYMIELVGLQKKYPDAKIEALAKIAANLMNDDFGGLHLSRIGKGGMARNPTIQHIFRLFALAPDWTESNIRSMVKAIGVGGQVERSAYRHFWARIFTRGALLTMTGNFLLNGRDTLDVYKRMWEEKKFPSVDVTNLYRALGGKADTRKYFSVFGHFLDPIKFVKDPIKAGHYKGSKLFNMIYEAIAGVDWAGRRFTTLPELLGYDKDKGLYQTTRKGYYKEGDPKWGKLKGKTVTWGFRRKAVDWSTVPSYILNQAFRSQPVPAQKLFSWILGEAEGFDVLLDILGAGIKTTYGGVKTAQKKGVTPVGEEKKLFISKIERKKIKKAKKILPYREFGKRFGISDPTARKVYGMSLEKRKAWIEKRKLSKFLKTKRGVFVQGLHKRKLEQMTDFQKSRYISITNQYKLQDKPLTPYFRKLYLKLPINEYLDKLEKQIKRGK